MKRFALFSLCLFTVFQAGCLRLSYDRCAGENPHPECDSIDASVVDASKDGGVPADAELDASEDELSDASPSVDAE